MLPIRFVVEYFGGQVFYGGLLGGIAGAVVYAKCARLEGFPDYADTVAPAIPLFHFFGRIGCFLGGCCYGIESDFGFVFTNAVVQSANGVRRFPVQLFESGFNLLLFIFLILLLQIGLRMMAVHLHQKQQVWLPYFQCLLLNSQYII